MSASPCPASSFLDGVALWDGLPFPALVITIGLTSWLASAGSCGGGLSLRAARGFVVAARALGADRDELSFPTSTERRRPIICRGLSVGILLLLEASLSFLGIGIKTIGRELGQHDPDGR